MRSTLRRVAGIVLTIMVATTGGIVAASPAQAAEGCDNTSPHSMEVIGTGAYASVIGTCRSSDMSVHGWLQDSACDSKSAKITVRVYYSGVTGSQLLWQNSVTHGGGCNTGRSYSFSGTGTHKGFVRACVNAVSTFSSTTPACRDIIVT